ncbi:MAG: type I-E CRISPR-associated protein Cas5/CasD [Paracoccus aminovorans]|nr:type I-E CRISPR-associated protein Cas5/CasD [Paracoccus aminovorans]MDQ7774409.1 type I-E CRISPR-associated protein Cas5/CasD [Paracoccus aminovorans]
MTHRWLHLRLASPLMAFGGVTIDHVGIMREFPSASALTGLFGNALGWQRHQGAEHQALQDRLVFPALSRGRFPGSSPTTRMRALMRVNQRGRHLESPSAETRGAAIRTPLSKPRLATKPAESG